MNARSSRRNRGASYVAPVRREIRLLATTGWSDVTSTHPYAPVFAASVFGIASQPASPYEPHAPVPGTVRESVASTPLPSFLWTLTVMWAGTGPGLTTWMLDHWVLLPDAGQFFRK
ncbi:hypothetical protein [Sorangium sp. So ce117]|uniref:hypothetical protein n=1 Tax=Sorangium sp. So ce117 TaxID=3133277 RepID=UPI003F61DE46